MHHTDVLNVAIILLTLVVLDELTRLIRSRFIRPKPRNLHPIIKPDEADLWPEALVPRHSGRLIMVTAITLLAIGLRLIEGTHR